MPHGRGVSTGSVVDSWLIPPSFHRKNSSARYMKEKFWDEIRLAGARQGSGPVFAGRILLAEAAADDPPCAAGDHEERGASHQARIAGDQAYEEAAQGDQQNGENELVRKVSAKQQ